MATETPEAIGTPETPSQVLGGNTLIDVLSAYYMDANGTIFCVIVMETGGVQLETNYVTNPTDPYGMSPDIRQWFLDHPEFVITPYVEPEPPEPLPYALAVEALWMRMTDDEGEAFDTALATATPTRLRRAFNLATTITSGTELFDWAKALLVTLFGATRAAALTAE